MLSGKRVVNNHRLFRSHWPSAVCELYRFGGKKTQPLVVETDNTASRHAVITVLSQVLSSNDTER